MAPIQGPVAPKAHSATGSTQQEVRRPPRAGCRSQACPTSVGARLVRREALSPWPIPPSLSVPAQAKICSGCRIKAKTRMASFTNSRAGDDRIGSLAQSTGCPVETIRYYERVGLVPPPLRTQGGHRVYGPEHRERLAFILRGRELGFSLEEIRELIGLTEQGDRACVTVEAKIG